MSRADPIPALKRQLGAELARLVTGWNGDDMAALLGTDRARVSELRRGKLARFSLETLIRYLARLRYRVDVTVVGERITRILPRAQPSPSDEAHADEAHADEAHADEAHAGARAEPLEE